MFLSVGACVCVVLAGLYPHWDEADGLCGLQPTELFGSGSDISSCHADMRSQPVFVVKVS